MLIFFKNEIPQDLIGSPKIQQITFKTDITDMPVEHSAISKIDGQKIYDVFIFIEKPLGWITESEIEFHLWKKIQSVTDPSVPITVISSSYDK